MNTVAIADGAIKSLGLGGTFPVYSRKAIRSRI
jgi:hypothetical protein